MANNVFVSRVSIKIIMGNVLLFPPAKIIKSSMEKPVCVSPSTNAIILAFVCLLPNVTPIKFLTSTMYAFASRVSSEMRKEYANRSANSMLIGGEISVSACPGTIEVSHGPNVSLFRNVVKIRFFLTTSVSVLREKRE